MFFKRIRSKLKNSIHSYIDNYKSTQNLLQDNKNYHSQKVKEIFKKVGHIPKKGTNEYYDYRYHINSMKNIEDTLEKREGYKPFNLFELADKTKSYETHNRLSQKDKNILDMYDDVVEGLKKGSNNITEEDKRRSDISYCLSNDLVA